MRFELIDRVIEQTDDRICTAKAVSSAEEYLADHFPGFPVLPGVMMLESLVQAARQLLKGKAPAADEPFVVTEVRNVRYGNMVRPGQVLEVQVQLRKQSDAEWEFEGIGRVNDQVAVQGRFKLGPAHQLAD